MPLAAGTRLGPYEIVAPIGAGGMGEVYRARDTRLARDVAIKILPEALANDPDRLARFEREAKVLASLNHPNVAQIYGLEERALVMELVEGESPKGPMSFDEAWRIASQIAAGLEYAHERGIVHRDLKPANIKITPDGVVKLLDFGLAKAFSLQAAMNEFAEGSPTLTLGPTQVGAILGTPGYMAPEQSKGKAVDKQADIWAFGVVLYELLTGDRPFWKESNLDLFSNSSTREPELDRVPMVARHLLHECLQGDPKRRLRDVGDAGRLLGWSIREGIAESAQSVWFGKIGGIASLLLLLATAWLAFGPYWNAPRTERLLRYTIDLPDNAGAQTLAVSPEGSSVVIAATVKGKDQLWLRSFDMAQAQALPNTEDASYPFWSPDGHYIGFFAQGKLKRISRNGGPAETICEALDGRGGTWSRDGIILFAPSPFAGLQRVLAGGGTPSQVTKPQRGQSHRYPVFLPDGRRFLYLVSAALPDEVGTYLSSLDSRETKRIVGDDANAAFVSPTSRNSAGYLMFVRQDSLVALPFDYRGAHQNGEPLVVAENVTSNTPHNNYSQFAVSNGGVLVYRSGTDMAEDELEWFDRNGNELGSLGKAEDFALAPDGRRVLIARRSLSDNSTNLWIHDIDRGTDRPFTARSGVNRWPVWSPQSDRAVFRSNRTGVGDLFQKAVNETGDGEVLLHSVEPKFPYDWSYDGRFLIYASQDPSTRFDLWALSLIGDPKPFSLVRSEFDEYMGQLSPDGRWLSYVSNESGHEEVYVQPFLTRPGLPTTTRWPISVTGGREPRWRRDGKELFYLAPDGKLMAVDVRGGTTEFTRGSPRALFTLPVAEAGPRDLRYHYQPVGDANRLLVIASPSVRHDGTLSVVVNWQAAVKK